VGRTAKSLVAGFDAVVMAGAAYTETGGGFAVTPAYLILWGAAVAAAICAIVVFANGSSIVAWSAIGYILFGGLLTSGGIHWPLLALAVALMALVPQPRGSLWYGIALALVVAIAARVIIGLLI
jgi:hypothetical protein